jgi:NADH pyrophosphatase NudC (nudix superfamily)
LFCTCTNTSQAATYTCNIYPRISPYNVVNHTSHQEATILRSSKHTWSSISLLMSGFTTHTYSNTKEKEKKRNK